jgi:hypothetical protein
MVEDEFDYWTSSRYIHPNPVRARLVRRPEPWEWSSYPGYRDPQRAQAWMAHDALLEVWQGERGGRRDPRRGYVRFGESGLADPPASPFREAFGGWILGSERFVARLRNLAGAVRSNPSVPEARRLAGLDPKRIMAAVAELYGLEGAWLSRRGDPHLARPVAAWLCRRETEASLRQRAAWLGLSRADSVPDLTRRLERQLKATPELSADLSAILRRAIAPDAERPQPTIPASLARGVQTGQEQETR